MFLSLVLALWNLFGDCSGTHIAVPGQVNIAVRVDLLDTIYHRNISADLFLSEAGRDLLSEPAIPKRRDPISGFGWYNGSHQLDSRSYWASSMWTGFPYMIVAGAWTLFALIFSIIRCVCCAQGEV